MLGHNTPPVGMFDEHTGRAIEKAFFDHMWTIPLVEMEASHLLSDARLARADVA